jgi:hypothetical protein
VRAHELAPRHPASRADRSDTSSPKPGSNRRGGDDEPGTFHLSDDALITPLWILASETECQCPDVTSRVGQAREHERCRI